MWSQIRGEQRHSVRTPAPDRTRGFNPNAVPAHRPLIAAWAAANRAMGTR